MRLSRLSKAEPGEWLGQSEGQDPGGGANDLEPAEPGRADTGKEGWACGRADCGDSGCARVVGSKSRPRVASRSALIVTKVKDKTAGRVPQDALLFIQAAIKSKQKGPLSCGGHGIRVGRRLFSPVRQLTGWRLRSTEWQTAPAEQVQMGRIDPAVPSRGGWCW